MPAMRMPQKTTAEVMAPVRRTIVVPLADRTSVMTTCASKAASSTGKLVRSTRTSGNGS
jgi:hypothetical protein